MVCSSVCVCVCVCVCMAGGNGTAVPVLREKKWHHWDSNLHVRYGIASLSGLS